MRYKVLRFRYDAGARLKEVTVKPPGYYNWRGQRMGIKKWENVLDTTGGGTCFNWNTGTSTWAGETWTIRDEGGRVLAEFDREPETGTVWWVRDNYHLFGRTVAAYGAFIRNPFSDPLDHEPSRGAFLEPLHCRSSDLQRWGYYPRRPVGEPAPHKAADWRVGATFPLG